MEPVPVTGVIGSSPPLTLLHRYHVLLKAHYFFFFSAFGTLYPILSVTLRSRGLSTTEISYMNLIIPFLVFFTNPLMGFVADQSRRFRLTFNLLLAIVTILYGVMFLLPSIKNNHIQGTIANDGPSGGVLKFCGSQEVATTCASRSECGCSYSANCTLSDGQQIPFVFFMNSNETRQQAKTSVELNKRATCSIDYEVPVEKYLSSDVSAILESSSSPARCEITCTTSFFCQGERFPQQTSYIVLYWMIFIVGTNLLSNAITLGASIGFASLLRPEIFGQQRVWGTVGFGLSAFAASRAYAYFHTEMVYIIMFSIATTLCILVTSAIRIQDKRAATSQNRKSSEQEMEDVPVKISAQETGKEKKTPKSSPFKAAALIPLLKRTDVIVFLSLTLIWGTSYAALDPYVYLYIDEIVPCGSRSIIGLMSLIAASSEVVALFLSGRMLKWIGTNASSVIILLAFSIRFSGYYFIRRPYFLLFMEIMHYFNFGILYVLIAQKADSIAPPGLSSTLQGVVYGLSFGLGRGVGLIASSFIYARYESRFLFLIYAIYNAVAAVLYTIYFLFKQVQSKKSNRPPRHTNVPKIVIEADTNANDEPLLASSSTGKNETKPIE